MEKFCIIVIDWNLKGDDGYEVLAVTTKDKAKKCFKNFVEQEKSETYLNRFFNTDGTLKDGVVDELDEYIDTDTTFMFGKNDYEYYTKISIIEKPIWNEKE